MATQPGYRPGFRVGGPGLADQQRAAKRASSDAPPSSDHLRARAELRAKLPKGGSRGSSSAFAPSPEASGDEAEDPNTRVVTVGKISAQFVLPPASSVPEEKPPPKIGAALPHALKKQRKKVEQERKKAAAAAPRASATAAVLQAQADRLLEQSSLEARAMAGEFADGAGQGAGRLGLWDHPADTHDTYVPNPTRVPASGAALGRIVGQVQTHNRLLQQDEMWRRHKEGKESGSAAAPSGGAPVRPPAPDRAAEILAAREEAAQRKTAARAASEGTAAAAPAPPPLWAADDVDDEAVGREKRGKRDREEDAPRKKKHKSGKKEKKAKREKKEKKEKKGKKAKKAKKGDGARSDSDSSDSESAS